MTAVDVLALVLSLAALVLSCVTFVVQHRRLRS